MFFVEAFCMTVELTAIPRGELIGASVYIIAGQDRLRT